MNEYIVKVKSTECGYSDTDSYSIRAMNRAAAERSVIRQLQDNLPNAKHEVEE